MSLLPKSRQDFTQTEYWNSFFKKRGTKSFEWYGEYPELCGHLHKYIKPKDVILNVGCGNSKLTMDLYDVGCKNIVNIDVSPLVIKQMSSQNKTTRPEMEYIQMDACKMDTFEDGKFSVVLDKATLDAVLADETAEVKQYVEKYWSEIDRVLRIGGRYVCISLLQKHIIEAMIDRFAMNNWMFRVVRCLEAEEKSMETSNDGSSLPVFMVIATKFQKLPSNVLEVCMAGEKMTRVSSGEEVVNAVLSAQKAALVCNGLHRSNIADMDEVSLDLYQPSDSENPRFTVYILDQKGERDNKTYAAFIVPQGRETDWLFSTPQGRKKLLFAAKYNRLAIVSMHREHVYTSWEDVKAELDSSIRNLAPSGNKEIPYLSLGSDVGKRKIIYKGKSNLSGSYVIEEVNGEGNKVFRRLIFLSNQFTIQSEALVKVAKGKESKNGALNSIEPAYLTCKHHLVMSVGIHFIKMICPPKNKKNVNIAMIGLGGGCLCTFIHETLKYTNITAVDIDPAMLSVATDYFGLTQDNRLRVVIDDGIEFLKKAVKNGQSFKALLVDVDNKDPTVGMSCPPVHFLNPEVLDVIKACIKDNGIFILNLVCRDEQLRDKVLDDLRKAFHTVGSHKLDEDVNEILYCLNAEQDNAKWVKALEQSVKHINSQLTNDNQELDHFELQDFFRELAI